MESTTTPARQRLLLVAVMSGLLLAMLDQTVVGTALPHIITSLGGGSLYVWVVTAYLVPATVSLPVYARLSDRFGRKRLLLVGMALFLAGSALAATAQSMNQLIAWRGLQGLGAGALEGLTFILVSDLYSGRRSASLQGALAGLMGFSFVAGPLIGGFLSDDVGWRWVFLVNLPIGLAAMAVVARVLPRAIGRHEGAGSGLDLSGIALLTASVGLALIGLSERADARGGSAVGAWVQWRTGGLIVAGLVLAAGFVANERRAAMPIVPLRLFSQRASATILLTSSFAASGLYAVVLLVPRYVQTVQHVSATRSGLLIYPLLLGVLVSANGGAALMVRRGRWQRVLLYGCGLALLGAAGFATFDAHTPRWQTLIFLGLLGLGIGPTFSGLQIALQRAVPPREIAGALGTLLLLRQIGGSIALAAANTVYLARADGSGHASATGIGVLSVSLAGTIVAVLALLSLPPSARRLAPVTQPPGTTVGRVANATPVT